MAFTFTEQEKYALLIFIIFICSFVFSSIICDFIRYLSIYIQNRKSVLNRKLKITLTVNEIYLIQKSLCFRAKVMDDYSSHHSYELIDKLAQELSDNRVPVDLKKICFRDFDDDL